MTGDLISRQAVLEIIEKEIEKLSRITPQQKAGRWGICKDTDGICGVYSIPNIEVTAVTPLSQPCKAKSEDAISRQAAIDTIESWLSCDDYNEAERHIMRAMQSVLYDLPSVTLAEKVGQFAEWVAREIFDENWELNKDAFAELACRKLAKLGIVRAKGDEWELVESRESEG